jgi:hypothetical protein
MGCTITTDPRSQRNRAVARLSAVVQLSTSPTELEITIRTPRAGARSCLSLGSRLEESRYGQWEPYNIRVSHAVLREALGETPEV